MVTSFAESTATNIADYVTELTESPDDAQSEPELLPGQTEIQDGQSSAPGEQVAPDTDPVQSTESDETPVVEADSSVTDSAPTQPNWDSPENPHLAATQRLEAIQQWVAEEQAKKDEAERRQQFQTALEALAEADEGDDRSLLTGRLIDEIQQSATAPVLAQKQVVEHGMTALVAAVETVFSQPAPTLAKVQAEAARLRELGETPQQIEQNYLANKNLQSQFQSQLNAQATQIRNLTAQLAAKAIQDSGVNRTESTTVGANGTDEPQTMLEYLTS